MIYKTKKPGTWIAPTRDGYRVSCCDCGLVHVCDFRTRPARGGGRMIQYRSRRDERATGQVRRWMKKEGKTK